MTNYSRSVLKSNGLRHSKILPVKFGFSLKTVHANIAKKSLPQCCSKPLFIAFSTSRTNGPHSLSRMKSGTHATPAPNRAHSGSHGETRGLLSPGHNVALRCQRNCHRKNSRRKWMHALWRVSAFAGAAAPLGCAAWTLLFPQPRAFQPC